MCIIVCFANYRSVKKSDGPGVELGRSDLYRGSGATHLVNTAMSMSMYSLFVPKIHNKMSEIFTITRML